MAKWATRFALALSTSVPTLRIKPENLIQIADEGMSPDHLYPIPPLTSSFPSLTARRSRETIVRVYPHQ